MADPQPVSDIDEDAKNALRLSVRFIYGLMISLGTLVVVLAGIVGVLSYRSITEHQRTDALVHQVVSSQCGFDYPVAIIPVEPKTTSKLGVQLVEGARVAVKGLGCPQHLGPPPPALIQLGNKYGIGIR